MFKLKNNLLAVALISMYMGSAVDAQADYEPATLTFDGIVADTSLQVPDGYGGFNWGTSYFATLLTPSPVTGPYVALTSSATSIVRSDGEDFYFDGAEFWSRRGADANGSFYFYLAHDGEIVFDGREDSDNRMRFTGTPTFMSSGYTGPIDYMAIVFQQGGDDYDHLALDNFQFRALAAPVPEPSTYMMMAVGLGLVGWVGRSRAQRGASVRG